MRGRAVSSLRRLRVMSCDFQETSVDGTAGGSACGSTRSDRPDQPAIAGHAFAFTPDRGETQTRLLRLSFQRDPLALVQPRRPCFVVHRSRCDARAKGSELLRMGELLPGDPATKARMDGALAARGEDAAVVVQADAPRRASYRSRCSGAAGLDRIRANHAFRSNPDQVKELL